MITRSGAEQPSDEPEPVKSEVQPDEDFTREDFMRDLRKFIPTEENAQPEK